MLIYVSKVMATFNHLGVLSMRRMMMMMIMIYRLRLHSLLCVSIELDLWVTGEVQFTNQTEAEMKASPVYMGHFNSLWPSNVIWRQGPRSTLVQVMAWCLTAPSHYLNQC